MRYFFIGLVLTFTQALNAEESVSGINSQGWVAVATGLALLISERADTSKGINSNRANSRDREDRRKVIIGVGALAFIGATIYESRKKDKSIEFTFQEATPSFKFVASF